MSEYNKTRLIIVIAIIAVCLSVIGISFTLYTTLGNKYIINQGGYTYIGRYLPGKSGEMMIIQEDGGIVFLYPFNGPIEIKLKENHTETTK